MGPAIAAVVDPDSFAGSRFLLSALPTILPLLALAAVVVIAYRRTHSVKVSIVIGAAGFVFAVLGALVLLIAVWPSGH